MALVSPGTEITIIDQSQYLPAAPASVPIIFLATAQNKSNAAGTGVAVGTTAANANKLFQVTSQRDLVTLYGNPFFYKTTSGTPIQGYELNEYGLLAAYSLLGTTNLCYVLRADIDLASLVGRTGRPSSEPVDGTYWLDTTNTKWGIFEFNQATGMFSTINPIIITDSDLIDGSNGQPVSSVGNIGDYAVVMMLNVNDQVEVNAPDTYETYWFKNAANTWVSLGSNDWRLTVPTIQGSATPVSVTGGNLILNTVTVTISGGSTVAQVATAINDTDIPSVTAAEVNGKLEIYLSKGNSIVVGSGSTAGVLTSLGLSAGTFYGPLVTFGTNAQQPLWRTTDSQPRPTGSVWIKTNRPNNGMNLVVNRYSATTATFESVACPVSVNDWTATNNIDPTGGKNIAEGTLYAQYSADTSAQMAPIQLFRRFASGPATFVGSETNPSFDNNATFDVYVSVAGSTSLDGPYTVTLPGSGVLGAADFVTAWTAANIPSTVAVVDTTGAIVLSHLDGGEIIMDDYGITSPRSAVTDAGFVIGATPGAKWGPAQPIAFDSLAVTGGSGTNARFDLVTTGYTPVFSLEVSGAGYVAGEILTVVDGDPLGAAYQIKVLTVNGSGAILTFEWYSGFATPVYGVQLSNWRVLSYTPRLTAPTASPVNNTNWFFSVVNQVDIMTNQGGAWKGYRNVCYASNGLPQATGTPATDPAGPIVAAAEPTTQSDGTALVYGDLWIDSGDLENYPVIYRWQNVNGSDEWVLIDNANQTTETGILFADARWATAGTVNPITDPIPSISSMLTSNYLDLDAPDPSMYPQGTLLFNTRRSGYNVKQFRVNYFNANSFPDQVLPSEKNAWVTVSGLQTNGAPYMGRKAQRAMVVAAMKASIGTNVQIREEQTFFNLMAAPNYCELQPDMIVLNNDRNNTAYIIGDTPLRLAPDANAITSWATNANGVSSTGEDGLVTRDTYMGLYYPCGMTTDLTGAQVVVPPSHMMLRTMIYNDQVAYPWFAPAGERRGIVSNASSLGYIDAATGEYVTDKNRLGLRNIEYTNYINPIAEFQNIGLLNYGNKNSFDSMSALDRTNVARLVCYLRERLQAAVRPFIFEPNDTITRSEAAGVVATLLNDILSKRGIYDYLVVCDGSNNTPARIDRNELWIDIAIEPVKAIEFIYIPIRILNTGEIAGLGLNG